MPRILLYSDEPVSTRGLELVLRDIEGFELLPPCNTVESVLAKLAEDTPDLVLLDITGDVTFSLLAQLKHVMLTNKIVLWASAISTELAFHAMGFGVRGVIRKTLPVEMQVECMRNVIAGEMWFEKSMTDRFLCSRRVSITRREGQLISLIAQGMSNKEISNTLLITVGTVKVYLSRLFAKIGAQNRWEAAVFGLKNLTSGHELHKPAVVIPGLRSLVLDPIDPKRPQAGRVN